MPLECSCSFCGDTMYDTSPGCYPPICWKCWVTYPEGDIWKHGLGLEIANLLDLDGVISIDDFS